MIAHQDWQELKLEGGVGQMTRERGLGLSGAHRGGEAGVVIISTLESGRDGFNSISSYPVSCSPKTHLLPSNLTALYKCGSGP